MRGLTFKQRTFAKLYFESGNASDAYRRAYAVDEMSDAAVRREAARLRRHAGVLAYLEQLRGDAPQQPLFTPSAGQKPPLTDPANGPNTPHPHPATPRPNPAHDPLTPRQARFAELVASDRLSLSRAYREAYDASAMLPETVHSEASTLAKHPTVAARIEALREMNAKPPITNAWIDDALRLAAATLLNPQSAYFAPHRAVPALNALSKRLLVATRDGDATPVLHALPLPPSTEQWQHNVAGLRQEYLQTHGLEPTETPESDVDPDAAPDRHGDDLPPSDI